MDWRCGSSGRAPDLQAQNFEFKFKSHKKIKIIKIKILRWGDNSELFCIIWAQSNHKNG
jgi:hypothetical protein